MSDETKHEFTCAWCGGTFPKSEADDEAAEAEYRALFPNSAAADDAREEVCDGCFQRMTRQMPPADWDAQRGPQ